jgi:hypothetical protein
VGVRQQAEAARLAHLKGNHHLDQGRVTMGKDDWAVRCAGAVMQGFSARWHAFQMRLVTGRASGLHCLLYITSSQMAACAAASKQRQLLGGGKGW